MTLADFKRDRLAHFTFAWYTFPMSTGGLALVLLTNSLDSVELRYFGKMLYFVNIFIFLAVTLTMVARFVSGSASLSAVLKHPLESVFIGPALLAFATIINGAASIAGNEPEEGLHTLLRVLFWSYTGVAFLQSLVSYFLLWNEGQQKIENMTPGWVLPVFPSMLVGTVANAVIPTQPPERAYEMAIAGSTFQGFGFAFSCMMYAILYRRLMTCGFPHVNHRPGIFMCAGPPSFTALAIIGMAKESARFLPEAGVFDIPRDQMVPILRILATVSSVFLWFIAAWFFCIALVSIVIGTIQQPSHMTFVLAWWAFIFPNVGFTIATKALSQALNSEPIRNLSVVLTIFLMVAWPVVLCFMIEAVFSRKIMWHGKDEDRDLNASAHAHTSDDSRHGDQQSGDQAAELKRFKTSLPNSPDQLCAPDYFTVRCEHPYGHRYQNEKEEYLSNIPFSLRHRHTQSAHRAETVKRTGLHPKCHHHTERRRSSARRARFADSTDMPYDSRCGGHGLRVGWQQEQEREHQCCHHDHGMDWDYDGPAGYRRDSGPETVVATPNLSPKMTCSKEPAEEQGPYFEEIQVADSLPAHHDVELYCNNRGRS